MVKIIHTELSYLNECVEAGPADKILITDMFETFREWKNTCNYLSANMLGFNKKIFLINYHMVDFLFINPKIIKGEDEFQMGQTCPCYKAHRTANRYKKIDVEFLNSNFEKSKMHLEGDFAVDFQHMMDHINGKRI